MCLSILGELWWWVTIVIVVREVGITVWRLVELRRGNVVPASSGGKLKTVVQSVAISLALLPLWTIVGDWIYWLNWAYDGGGPRAHRLVGAPLRARRRAPRAHGPRGALRRADAAARRTRRRRRRRAPRRVGDAATRAPAHRPGPHHRDGRVADRRAARGDARRRARRLGRLQRGSGGLRHAREALRARRRRRRCSPSAEPWIPRSRSRWPTGVRRVCAVDGRPADVGLATTGVAGPDPQDGQPPGTVYVGGRVGRRHPLGRPRPRGRPPRRASRGRRGGDRTRRWPNSSGAYRRGGITFVNTLLQVSSSHESHSVPRYVRGHGESGRLTLPFPTPAESQAERRRFRWFWFDKRSAMC